MASLSDILNSPLSPPPAGVESNFINPESDGYVLIVIESICLVLMVCFTAIRVYAKGFVARKVTWDDCKLMRIKPRVAKADLCSDFHNWICTLTDLLHTEYCWYDFHSIWCLNMPIDFLGVRSCYVGYNAWDVKVGQLSASDFFLV